MGKWLDLGLSWDETIKHMGRLGIRKCLAETLLLIEQKKITGDIEEKRRPRGALMRFVNDS